MQYRDEVAVRHLMDEGRTATEISSITTLPISDVMWLIELRQSQRAAMMYDLRTQPGVEQEDLAE
jgi:hypothetical protein